MRTRVKICGITREEDALVAARSGADAIGLVFHPDSPRAVSPEQAARICAALPAFVTSVGLFVDAPAQRVRDVLAAVPLDLLQFHGDEDPQDCAAFGRPWIKALRMREEMDPAEEVARHGNARAVLLDSYRPGVPGGTGERFDWSRVPDGLALPVVLAGGLDPDNVADAIRAVRPWAVDVSGGVEARDDSGTPLRGIKSPSAIAAFMKGVEGV